MLKLSLVLLPTCTAALLTIQLLMAPIFALKRTSDVDEFMIENERTRMRQNYVLQRALNNDIDKKKIGVTFVREPFDPNTNPEELPALIVDYANMIRNDIVLLDNSVETRTRKRGNIKVKKYIDDALNDVPCMCEQEEREPKVLGSDYFPRYIETRNCDYDRCPSPYKCQERLHNVTVLKRKRFSSTYDSTSDELPDDLKKKWVAIKKPVTVGCFCIRDYNDRI